MLVCLNPHEVVKGKGKEMGEKLEGKGQGGNLMKPHYTHIKLSNNKKEKDFKQPLQCVNVARIKMKWQAARQPMGRAFDVFSTHWW